MRKRLAMVMIIILAAMPFMGLRLDSVKAADYVFIGGGNGTLSDPYIILLPEDLNRVRDDLNASYRLQVDIDLSIFNNWEPIGTAANKFEGNFDGAGYTISGMTIDSDAEAVGLFGHVSGTLTVPATITNVHLADVDITSTDVYANVGGLVGQLNRGIIDRCSVTGTIEGVAFAFGGLVGQAYTDTEVANSYSHVNLNAEHVNTVGGLVGGTNGIIDQSYATGSISSGGAEYVGGLAGSLLNAEVTNSYASGSVAVEGSAANIGGLVGEMSGAMIVTSYAVGIISPDNTGSLGGMVGMKGILPGGVSTITNSYWNESDNPGLQTVGGVSGMDEAVSASGMKKLDTYAGWDANIWGIREVVTYPYLKTFAPVLRADLLPAAFSTKPGNNELVIAGSIRDGSIGEPLEIAYLIQNAEDAAVASDVYTTYATGHNQTFQLATTLSETDYPDGDYTLTVTWKDTVLAHEQSALITFAMDSTAPEISMSGPAVIELEIGDAFTDPGATAEDNRDGDLTAQITRSGAVDTSQTGTYTLAYEVSDALGNTASATRTVIVYNSLYPDLQLNGLETVEVEVGDTFDDPGATASDERDGDMTDQIVVSGTVDTGLVGIYSIDYRVTNSSGYETLKSRIVEVVDNTPPTLTLEGANPMQLTVGSPFTDPGATAFDVGDGDLTADIAVSGSVDTNQAGSYTLTYSVQDRWGNMAADAVRTVNVVRPSYPIVGGGQTDGGQSDDNPAEEPTEEDNAENTAPSAPGCVFTDIEKHWAKPDICEAAELGIVEGTSPHIFMPNADITRTEFAVMLLRALRIEIDNEAGAVPFSDRDSIPKWALQAIQTAVAEGVLTGYPDGTLRPMQTVSRSEMAAMLSRAMKWETEQKRSAYFSDEAVIPTWAKGYVEAAREHGILAGRSGNRFEPYGLTTRAEAAVALLRLWKMQQ